MIVKDNSPDVISSPSNLSTPINQVSGRSVSDTSLRAGASLVSQRLNAALGAKPSTALKLKYSRCFHAIAGSLQESAYVREGQPDESLKLAENERLLWSILDECEVSIKAVRCL